MAAAAEVTAWLHGEAHLCTFFSTLLFTRKTSQEKKVTQVLIKSGEGTVKTLQNFQSKLVIEGSTMLKIHLHWQK